LRIDIERRDCEIISRIESNFNDKSETPDAMNTKYSIAHMSYYARESAKLLIVNFIENIKSTFPIFHLLRV